MSAHPTKPELCAFEQKSSTATVHSTLESNTVMSATLLAAGEYITCRDLPAEVTGGPAEPAEAPLSLRDPASEEEQIRRALATAGGNKSQAAKLLGIDRKTLYNKLHLYGIE